MSYPTAVDTNVDPRSLRNDAAVYLNSNSRFTAAQCRAAIDLERNKRIAAQVQAEWARRVFKERSQEPDSDEGAPSYTITIGPLSVTVTEATCDSVFTMDKRREYLVPHVTVSNTDQSDLKDVIVPGNTMTDDDNMALPGPKSNFKYAPNWDKPFWPSAKADDKDRACTSLGGTNDEFADIMDVAIPPPCGCEPDLPPEKQSCHASNFLYGL